MQSRDREAASDRQAVDHSRRSALRRDLLALGAVALAVSCVHLIAINRYGVFRDEMYYVACGEHLAWGYVDHPPLVAVMAWLSRHVLGHSLLALRILPVLMGAATVFVTGAIARRLGGGRFAQVVAGIAVAIAPQYLFIFHVMSMNSIEVLLWALAFYLIVRAVDAGFEGEPRRPTEDMKLPAPAGDLAPLANRHGSWSQAWPWIAFGVVCGLGLLNKHSMLFLGMGVFPGLIMTPARRVLRSPWPWIAAAIAGVMFLPHIHWQMTHDWPTLEFIRDAKQYKIQALSPLGFLKEQVMLMNPFTLPLWLGGLWFFVFGGGRRYRLLAWCYLAVPVLLVAQRSKAYYLSPAYTLLIAGGAVALERLIAWALSSRGAPGRRQAVSAPSDTSDLPERETPTVQARFLGWRRALQASIVAILVVGGALVAPLVVPLMPPERLVRYMIALGISPSSGERQRLGALPQHFADTFGWEDLARTVSEIYRSLPAEERASARVFAQNYGEAGAIDFFRGKYDLPPVLCPHNNYWYWGPDSDGGTLIIIGGAPEDHHKALEQVEEVARRPCANCMPYEADLPIFVCRGWKVSLKAIWPAEKHFI